MPWWLVVLIVVGALLAAVVVWDLVQTRHAILRNFPIIGHLRYMLERIGPELRQYIVTDNDEERPFSRDQRRWVYATAKRENSYFGFGSDNTFAQAGYVLVRHATFPLPLPRPDDHTLIAPKVLGAWRSRPGAFRPSSIVNTSAMSFGSLSGPAVEAINRGVAVAGCLQNTGEGGIAAHHRHGGELIFQFGTGYFGCRDPDGRFSMDALVDTVGSAPVRAIEVKLSQGAKPGVGGVLPGAKVTAEIAATRGVARGETVLSPNHHHGFTDVAGLVEFVESIAAATGLPVGIKSAVGQPGFWTDLADHMAASRRGPDFVAVDGGEGGTGAGPLVFTDHVALPFRAAMAEVYRAFAQRDLQRDLVFIGSGKLGFPAEALAAVALGADMINVGREAMLAIGCVQAQRCHTGHCPTGVATQSRWLMRGLHPTDKAARLANYVCGLRHDLLALSRACGATHPSLVDPAALEAVVAAGETAPLLDRYDYAEWSRLHASDVAALEAATSTGGNILDP